VAWFGVTQGIVTALPAPAPQWLLLAALMSLAVLAANFALQYGAARLSAHSTALIMLSEVVFASASSVWLSAAQPDARTLVGGALILLAAALSAWPTGAVKPT
jgi:drug/metabolite transporter (DMT)-like permease